LPIAPPGRLHDPLPDLGLRGQVAIVTGASSGLGRAAATALGRSGVKVIVNHIESEADAAAEVVRGITDHGGTARAVAADVSREDQVQALFADAVGQFGTVQILVNNAGIERGSAIEDMDLHDWQRVIDVNLTGQFLCAREAVREFLRRGPQPEISLSLGKIICMSSVHQVIPWAFQVNYAASKGGISLMMESLAQELAPRKVRVNAIAPGAIRTPINRDAWGTEAAMNQLLHLMPYGRIGEPTDIAYAVLWLASDYSDYMTGTTMFVDGGMTLYPGFRGNG
jgi:glucose 1-dehydrogenase